MLGFPLWRYHRCVHYHRMPYPLSPLRQVLAPLELLPLPYNVVILVTFKPDVPAHTWHLPLVWSAKHVQVASPGSPDVSDARLVISISSPKISFRPIWSKHL